MLDGQITLWGLLTSPETPETDVFSVLHNSNTENEKESISAFLRLSNNTDNTRMIIVSEFSKRKDNKSKVDFLKEVYHGGCGCEISGKKKSCFFDEYGMHINNGESAFGLGSKIIEWEEVSGNIEKMLKEGKFATSEEISGAPLLERKMLAEALWYLYHDLTKEGKSFFTCFDILETFKGFPDDTAMLTEKLQNGKYLKRLKTEFDIFADELAKDNSLIRFRYHKIDRIKCRISDMFLPRAKFDSCGCENDCLRFITKDEIEETVGHGSNYYKSKERIIEFFDENSDSEKRQKFLAKEYGTGGRSHAVSGQTCSGEEHGPKGLTLKKQGCKDVVLSYSEVEKIISKLIKEGRFTA